MLRAQIKNFEVGSHLNLQEEVFDPFIHPVITECKNLKMTFGHHANSSSSFFIIWKKFCFVNVVNKPN